MRLAMRDKIAELEVFSGGWPNCLVVVGPAGWSFGNQEEQGSEAADALNHVNWLTLGGHRRQWHATCI